jgi:hypothetical protein
MRTFLGYEGRSQPVLGAQANGYAHKSYSLEKRLASTSLSVDGVSASIVTGLGIRRWRSVGESRVVPLGLLWVLLWGFKGELLRTGGEKLDP